MSILKWNDFLESRENGEEVKVPVSEVTSEKTKESLKTRAGVEMDEPFRDEEQYKKMLEFLRGKKNTPNIEDKPEPPKDSPKGWFVVDESSRGFWHDGEWTTNGQLANDAILESEKAAEEIAKAVGGIVIASDEIFGS